LPILILNNHLVIFCLVPSAPPLEHALVQTFVVIIYHQLSLFYWLIYAHLHRRSFDSSNFSNWFILRNWCVLSVMRSLYYHSFTLQWDLFLFSISSFRSV